MKEHLTAIARKTASAPARYLDSLGLIQGRTLDYGCGRGKDADTYGIEKFDTHYSPQRPEGTFDTILCTYVLNVVTEEEQETILQDILSLMNTGGKAYISVRRDFKEDYVSSKGTLQRFVTLPLQVLKKTAGFCTYVLEAN